MKKQSFKLFTEEEVKELSALVLAEKTQTFIVEAKGTPNPEELGTFKMLITTPNQDRQGESVKMEAWQIDNYLKNPVVLLCHNYYEFPIGATTKLTMEAEGMVAEGIFAPTEEGQKARKLYDLGFLKTASVGFIAWERDKSDRSIITQAELLEWSFVPVPANPEAVDQLKAQGFEAKDLQAFGIVAKEMEIKEGEPVEQKGAVEDELNAEEQYEQKCKNVDQVRDIIWAFYDVYFDQATPVEDFSKLLAEVITLLQAVAPAPAETVEDGMVKSQVGKELSEATKKFIGIIEEKSGKVLSEASIKLIKGAIEHMTASMDSNKEACGVLNDLLNATEPTDQGKGTDKDQIIEKTPSPTLGEKEIVKVLQIINSVTNNTLKNYKGKK